MNPDKKPEMNTLELARLYENQGYHEDAFKIYASLDAKQSSEQTRAGMERNQMPQPQDMPLQEDDLLQHDTPQPQIWHPAQRKIAGLIEEWLKLLVLKQRLEKYKRIQERLS